MDTSPQGRCVAGLNSHLLASGLCRTDLGRGLRVTTALAATVEVNERD